HCCCRAYVACADSILCYAVCRLLFFFFFFSSRRRHTRSYGDWSSDVCSSDLVGGHPHGDPGGAVDEQVRDPRRQYHRLGLRAIEIGRASCRERVWISVGAGAVKKKKNEE